MSAITWRFEAADTLFFKESRPIESVGASQLGSQFPPPARTLIGAIRTAIGDQMGGDWHGYKEACRKDVSHPVRDAIGTPDSLGPLSFAGPWLSLHGERLYSVPLVLLAAESGSARLQPGEPAHTDLGYVRLPQMVPAVAGAKPLEGAFVNAAGLQAILAGGHPEPGQMFKANGERSQPALFHSEERLGIARDNARRVTGDGLLYQTRHIRPAPGLAVEIEVKGAPPAADGGGVRLGAEGRFAHFSTAPASELPPLPVPPAKAAGLILLLLTPALFRDGWLPDGLARSTAENSLTVWAGELHAVGLRVVCSVAGKPVREGGWDMANHAPRPLALLVPAGSCYFVELAEGANLHEAARQLHGKQIGQEQELGRGQIAVGYWTKG